MARRVHNRSQLFLAAYRATCSITKAAEAAGIERGMHYRWLESDPEYKAEFEKLKEEAFGVLMDECVRRAVEGVKKPLVYQGQFTYASYNKKTGKGIGEPLCVREYSDSNLQFLMRGMKPEMFRERFEHTGKDGGPIEGAVTITFVKP